MARAKAEGLRASDIKVLYPLRVQGSLGVEFIFTGHGSMHVAWVWERGNKNHGLQKICYKHAWTA